MKDAPGQLRVRWGEQGVTVTVFPLRVHPEERRFWSHTGLRWLQLCVLATIPLIAAKALGVLDLTEPFFVYLAMGALAPVLQSALDWRCEQSELTVAIEPGVVRLIHRMGPFPVITETVSLEGLRRVDLHPHDTLRFVHQEGQVVSEPLPALTEEAREWLLDAIQEAREATGDFWRDQVQHASEETRLAELVQGAKQSERQ